MIIKPEEIDKYIDYVWHEAGEPITRSGSIWIARLKENLRTGTTTKEQLQAFMDWRENEKEY